MVVTFAFAHLGMRAVGHAPGYTVAIAVLLVGCFAAATFHAIRPTWRSAKAVEIASGVWTLGMYLLLGGLPMAAKLLGL